MKQRTITVARVAAWFLFAVTAVVAVVGICFTVTIPERIFEKAKQDIKLYYDSSDYVCTAITEDTYTDGSMHEHTEYSYVFSEPNSSEVSFTETADKQESPYEIGSVVTVNTVKLYFDFSKYSSSNETVVFTDSGISADTEVLTERLMNKVDRRIRSEYSIPAMLIADIVLTLICSLLFWTAVFLNKQNSKAESTAKTKKRKRVDIREYLTIRDDSK